MLRRQLKAIGPLPGVVIVLVPVTLVAATGMAAPGWGLSLPLAVAPILAGAALIGAGLTLMYRTITLFARIGRGTLAPWDPTQRLVVQGPYRHVRNPMITGVFIVLLGEATLLGSWPVLVWFALFAAGNAIYQPLVEEPGLVRRFGDDYVEYRRNVPRWIPRLRPWQPASDPRSTGQ